jgi:hypothetical protein
MKDVSIEHPLPTENSEKSEKLIVTPKTFETLSEHSPFNSRDLRTNEMIRNNENWTRPPEWADENRMAVLFGNLYHNFEDKFRFWSALIHTSSRELRSPCVSLPLLQQRFTRNQLVPKALRRVIEEMVIRRQLIPLAEYQSLGNQPKWYNVVWQTIKNTLKQWSPIKGSVVAVNDAERQQYVLWALIEEYAQQLLQSLEEWFNGKTQTEEVYFDDLVASNKLRGISQLVVTVEELLAHVRSWDQTRFNLLLPYLIFTQHVLVFKVNNTMAVKVALRGQVTAVTPQDRALLSLRLTAHQLNGQLRRLETEMENLRKEAVSFTRSHRKVEALLCLKRRHLLHEIYQKQSTALHNVTQIALQLQSAETNQQLLHVYRLGVEGLKAAQGPRHVDETLTSLDQLMCDFSELAQNQSEVETALSDLSYAMGDSRVTDKDVEDEYTQLIQEMDSQEKEKTTANLVKGNTTGDSNNNVCNNTHLQEGQSERTISDELQMLQLTDDHTKTTLTAATAGPIPSEFPTTTNATVPTKPTSYLIPKEISGARNGAMRQTSALLS